MSSTTKRVEGKAEQIGGKIKGAVGSLIGNRHMKAEGKATELKGAAKQKAAKAAERTRGTVEEMAGKAKNAVGRVVNSDQMRAEGKARELKGHARQVGNR